MRRGPNIGPYRIVRQIGEGGTGVVHLAERTDPIHQQVALKLVHPQATTADVARHFLAETRALERLDHANVARVYDAGLTEDGQPFIAMEYVPGVAITEACDADNATLDERIRLFIDVCRGVQHVHQKGLIHRDLKPQNILVMVREGRQVPKIIDFGIAKGTAAPLTDETLTRTGGLLGTPMYMAPEAFRGEALDTRSDVYSLGLVLHRLLVGAAPLPGDGANLVEQVEKLATGDAIPRPSIRFSQLALDERVRIADLRDSRPATLKRAFEIDLDWIVMKAIDTVDRRYATAAELADDLQSYLDGSPVAARPPSTRYLATKLARKHRWSLLAAAVLLLAMATGAVGTIVQAMRAADHARLAQAEAQRAQDELVAAEQITAYLVGLFEDADSHRGEGDATVRDVLDAAAGSIEKQALPALVRSDLLLAIGDVYLQLRLFERGLEPQLHALTIREAELGPDSVALINPLVSLAHAELRGGLYEQSIAHIERAEAILDANEGLERQRWGLLTVKAGYHLEIGDLEMAEVHFREALEHRMQMRDEESADLAMSLKNLAILALQRGDADAAEEWMDHGLEVLGPDAPGALMVDFMEIRSNLLAARGELEGSLQEAQRAHAMALEVHGEGPRVQWVHMYVGLRLKGVGRRGEANAVFEAIIESPDTPPVIVETVTRMLALNHIEMDQPGEAVSLLMAFEASAPQLQTQASMERSGLLARALFLHGDDAAAEPRMERVLEIGEEKPFNPPLLAMIRSDLGDLHADREDHRRAAALYAGAAREFGALLGEQDPEAIWSWHEAATSFRAVKAYKEAEEAGRRAVQSVDVFSDPDAQRAILEEMIALLVETDRTQEAETFRRQLAQPGDE